MGRGLGGPHHKATWPEGTTAGEVVGWAWKQFDALVTQYLAAAEAQDWELIRLHLQSLRHVVTRLEAFWRQEKRRWQVLQGSSQNR